MAIRIGIIGERVADGGPVKQRVSFAPCRDPVFEGVSLFANNYSFIPSDLSVDYSLVKPMHEESISSNAEISRRWGKGVSQGLLRFRSSAFSSRDRRVSGKARVADRGVARFRLATPQGGICSPTRRDKRPKIKNTTAIQRCRPLAQHDGTARTTPCLAAHRQFRGALGADSHETSKVPKVLEYD
ncbi:hypothetical protein [Salinisphaera sp. Q1T1-3]|uniref:hypothetical protein n=1 Tax=Salinisphaera sp. Q1T1-3 TaxID=2321229 RepID=UPI0013147038|nr:hypothetical protein [Salinisphaera sp. Q1T1-3]